MAKKRKKQEEVKKEKEYKPPEFDRIDFMRTEVEVSKATIFAAIFAIPMALAAMFTMPVGGVGGSLLMGLAGISFLYVLFPVLKINVKKFKITQWLGTISTYFLLFVALWVVFCNPPFSDFASPDIRHVQVSWDGGDWVNVTESGTGGWVAEKPANVTAATTLRIRAQVTDNADLNVNSVSIARGAANVTMVRDLDDENVFISPEYGSLGAIEVFMITASDNNGNDPATFSLSVV